MPPKKEELNESTTWIYLIHDFTTDCFKIGFSKDPLRRYRELVHQDTLMPTANDFLLVNAWPGDRRDERALHRRLGEYRVRGEWFNPPTIWPVLEYFYNSPSLLAVLTQKETDEWFEAYRVDRSDEGLKRYYEGRHLDA